MLMERYDLLYKQLMDIYYCTIERHKTDEERLKLIKEENQRLTSIAKDINIKANLFICKCSTKKDHKVNNKMTVEVSTNTYQLLVKSQGCKSTF